MAWKIDPSHTAINFTVKHMMFSKVNGRFKDFDGTIDPSALEASGTVRVASVDTGNDDRDNHLRSGDFFDVEQYPEMTFRATNVEKVTEDQYRVTGDLTIRDQTKAVTWNVKSEGEGKDPWGNQRRALHAETTIDRRDFGLTWNQALEAGGWLVGNDITISSDLQLIEVPDAEAEAATV